MKTPNKLLPAKVIYQTGVTMVELLIYMGLFMGFITILSGLFLSTLEAHTDSTANAHIDQDSWYILSRLQYDFSLATAVVTPASNGDTTSTLVLNQAGTQVTYSLVGDKLSLTKNSVTEPLVNQEVNVSNLTFQRLGNLNGLSSVKIQMDVTDDFRTQPQHLNFTLGIRWKKTI